MKRLSLLFSALVLPLAILLFAQWPLREWLHSYSRTANDAAQILFALYAAVSVTAATRSGMHLAIATEGCPVGSARRGWTDWLMPLLVAPWAVFLIWVALPQMMGSVRVTERFSEGLTPGYFVVRIALVLLPVLVLLDLLRSAITRWKNRRQPPAHQ
jgi:TRAP-type C4-dicarboxylate transport system permease small subunit